jgi:hypothetical protein
MKNLTVVALVGGIIFLMGMTSGEARKRPTIDSFGVCWNAPDADYDCDGTICTCCYDEGADAGCWVCNADLTDCDWDPKYSSAAPARGDTLKVSPEAPSKGRQQKLPKLDAPLSEPSIKMETKD